MTPLQTPSTPPLLWYRLAWIVTLGGGILMALEILASRVLAPHFGSSVYVWGSIISVFLAALSVGYVWGGRLADRDPTLAGLGSQVAWAALAQGALAIVARPATAWLASATGHSTWGTLVTTAVLFGIPSVLLGVISPYSVRLAARDPENLGGTVGRLYALSTAGSLAGTLGCTFLIVPYLSLERGLALLLFLTCATALVGLGREVRRFRLATVATVATLMLAGNGWRTVHQPGGGLLYERMTAYQTIEVHEFGGVRYLTSDGVRHGALDLATGDTALAYPQVAVSALLVDPNPGSMLVLGTGAGFAGTHLQRFLPELLIDFVDIDPAMEQIAGRFFGFGAGPTRRLHAVDARRFLDRAEAQWDYIYCDTYIGLAVPFHLATTEFFELAASRLAPDGVFGLNLAGGLSKPFPRAIYRTVRETFPHVLVFKVPASGNLLLLARRSPFAAPEELSRRAAELDRRHGFPLPLTQVLQLRQKIDLDFTDTPVLRDQFAPVDRLLHLDADLPALLRGETVAEAVAK